MEKIIGVAIIYNGKVRSIPSPGRHHDLIRILYQEVKERIKGEQGFITNTNKFLSRSEARVLVIKNGQCPSPRHKTLLFSEDLW